MGDRAEDEKDKMSSLKRYSQKAARGSFGAPPAK